MGRLRIFFGAAQDFFGGCFSSVGRAECCTSCLSRLDTPSTCFELRDPQGFLPSQLPPGPPPIPNRKKIPPKIDVTVRGFSRVTKPKTEKEPPRELRASDFFFGGEKSDEQRAAGYFFVGIFSGFFWPGIFSGREFFPDNFSNFSHPRSAGGRGGTPPGGITPRSDPPFGGVRA